MIQNFQQLKQIEEKQPSNVVFAQVGTVYDDGITLIFPGSTEETVKRYKANTSILFEPGQRVKLFKDSGTYIVEYPVGNPRRT